MRTAKALRPAQLDQIVAAGRLGRKALRELRDGAQIFLHPPSILAESRSLSVLTASSSIGRPPFRPPGTRRGGLFCLGARFEFRRTCHVRQLGIHRLSWAALTKCRFWRCIWGAKYSLRKPVNPVNRPSWPRPCIWNGHWPTARGESCRSHHSRTAVRHGGWPVPPRSPPTNGA